MEIQTHAGLIHLKIGNPAHLAYTHSTGVSIRE